MTIDLTNDEANTLAKLIDAAVRAGGIEAARAAVPLFTKLEEAARAASAPAPMATETK